MDEERMRQDIWETIAGEAGRESDLWRTVLLPAHGREPVAVFSPLAEEPFALGLETIYEGYLLHYGRPRLFALQDRDTSVLLGDYLYAHGLVRIADVGHVAVVADLAELLSLCAHLRAEPKPVDPSADGAVWAATVASLGARDERLAPARHALRDDDDPTPLVELASSRAGDAAVARSLALHADRLPRR